MLPTDRLLGQVQGRGKTVLHAFNASTETRRQTHEPGLTIELGAAWMEVMEFMTPRQSITVNVQFNHTSNPHNIRMALGVAV
jgi:hypothetical protein